MPTASSRRAALFIALASTSVAQSASPGRPVAMVVMPSRAREFTAAIDRAQRIVHALAARLGAPLQPAPAPAVELATQLAEARRLAGDGDVDRAAALLDVVLSRAFQSPERVQNGAELVAATIQRAAIALARGETAVADHLLDRLLRYDPSVALSSGEQSPRLRAALAQVRERIGEQPALSAEDLGDACASRELVVLRALTEEDAELVRYTDCQLTAESLLSPGRADELVLDELVPRPAPARPPMPPAIAAPAAPALVGVPQPNALRPRPIRKRPWFIGLLTVSVIAVVAGVAVGAWYGTRSNPSEFNVVPHL